MSSNKKNDTIREFSKAGPTRWCIPCKRERPKEGFDEKTKKCAICFAKYGRPRTGGKK